MFTSEDYGDGFAEALTCYFLEHGSRRTPVHHVCVDNSRTAVPISGTRLRGDPRVRRKFLAEPVRTSLVERVAVPGGESSGKTDLAQALAERLGTEWVPEYGRELWDARAGRLHLAGMIDIATVQIEREARAAVRAERWLICDTTPLTTAFYSMEMFETVDERLQDLASRAYRHILLCAPDFAFVQDGTRRDAKFRQRQHEWYVRELSGRGIGFAVLAGSLESRVETAASVLLVASGEDKSS